MISADLGAYIASLSWQVVSTLTAAYALGVAIFLILENRSPQSTFAWLFLFIVFPFGGVLIYLMVGRDRHVFSRARRLTTLLEGTTLADRAAAVITAQPGTLAALRERQGEYARLADMLWASA